LGDIGEFGWIARLARRTRSASDPGVLCGIGDDAAAIRINPPILITTDVLAEGVHFRREWGTSRQLGRRAFAVNASDIAAMGGRPAYALIDLRAPATFPVRELEAIYSGFRDAADRQRVVLIGGNTSSARRLSFGVTLLGRAPHGCLTRDRCRAGDDLYVTGTIGLAALGLAALRAGRRRTVAIRRFLEPPLRVEIACALARTGLVGGMIDVSDGLVQDLGHLCEASGVGAVIDATRGPVPAPRGRLRRRELEHALAGGEDYELLFSALPALSRRIGSIARRYRCNVSRIGRIVRTPRNVRVVDADGRPLSLTARGHDHFRKRR
jgi:thiamine-monophosphate kinase